MKQNVGWKDAVNVPQLGVGDKLYHYTSVEGLKGICDGEFWITEKNFLNDYTEFQIAADIFREVLDRHMRNKVKCEAIANKVIAEINRGKTPGLDSEDEIAYYGDYIISFCLDGDSPLLWSEYSGFTGYCMQFDFEKLLHSFVSDKNYIRHGRVIYNHDIQVSLIENVIKKQFFDWPQGFEYINSWDDFENLTDKEIDDLYWQLAFVIDEYSIFFKLPCFEGENEYRIVFTSAHDGGRYKPNEYVQQYFRIKDGVLIPYIIKKLTGLEALEKVIIGANNKSDIAVKGLQYYFRNKKIDVVIDKSKIPLRY